MACHSSGTLKLPQGVWRANQQRPEAVAAISSGFPALDALLPGGGWPLGMLTELLCHDTGIGELRLLIPLLQTLTQHNKTVFLLAPPHIPYPPGLLAYGIRLEPIVVITPKHPREHLWALEQTLRSEHFGALLAWLPRPTRHTDLRRMQVAAQHAQGPALLFRDASVHDQASPAPLRALLRPHGRAQLAIHVFKRRGPMLSQPIHLNLPPVAALPRADASLAGPIAAPRLDVQDA